MEVGCLTGAWQRGESWRLFLDDAQHAAASGYFAASQEWTGGNDLTVRYERRHPPVAPQVPPAHASGHDEPVGPPSVLAPPVPVITTPAGGDAGPAATDVGQVPPAKKSEGNPVLGCLVILVIAGIAVWWLGGRNGGPEQPGTIHRPARTDYVRQPAAAVIDDGVLRVGSDVQPGTYRSRVPVYCYWARPAGFGGTLDDIVTNANVSGYAVVTIKRSDVGFDSSGCERSRDLSPVITPGSTIPDGWFIVGTDVRPGTYRTTGDCYWARLSGFGGELDEIIANDNTTGSSVVTISPGDKGFETSGCDGWR